MAGASARDPKPGHPEKVVECGDTKTWSLLGSDPIKLEKLEAAVLGVGTRITEATEDSALGVVDSFPSPRSPPFTPTPVLTTFLTP